MHSSVFQSLGVIRIRTASLYALLAFCALLAYGEPKLGTLSGTVALVSSSGKFVGVARFARIRVRRNGDHDVDFIATDLGDFVKHLSPGRYILKGVTDCRGGPLALDASQVRDFEILPRRVKRFDIQIISPKGEYPCANGKP